MTCIAFTHPNLPIRALDNMGIPLNATTQFDPQAIVRRGLSLLTAREFDICVLHFIEGRSQLLIAEWFGIEGRTVRFHLMNALKKVPQLKRLQTKSKVKIKRPKMFHLSQLRPTERGPFNADEV